MGDDAEEVWEVLDFFAGVTRRPDLSGIVWYVSLAAVAALISFSSWCSRGASIRYIYSKASRVSEDKGGGGDEASGLGIFMEI